MIVHTPKSRRCSILCTYRFTKALVASRGRPWRVLLLNRGIVATRSHDPSTMEEAFTFLIRHLPEDAAQFFAAGMQQMEALNYPAHVRQVMEKYHRQWSLNRTLH